MKCFALLTLILSLNSNLALAETQTGVDLCKKISAGFFVGTLTKKVGPLEFLEHSKEYDFSVEALSATASRPYVVIMYKAFHGDELILQKSYFGDVDKHSSYPVPVGSEPSPSRISCTVRENPTAAQRELEQYLEGQ